MVLEPKTGGGVFTDIFDANIDLSFYIEGLESPYNSQALIDLMEPSPSSLQGIYRFSNLDSQNDFAIRVLEKFRKNLTNPLKYIDHGYKATTYPKQEREPEKYRKIIENIPKNTVRDLGRIGHAYISQCTKELKSDVILEKGDVLEVRGNMKSYGKGFSREQADLSAYFELVERWKSMLLTDKRPDGFYEYSIEDLKKSGTDYVDPSRFTNCLVPTKKGEKIEWVKATEMVKDEESLIPAGIAYFLLFPREGLYYPFFGNSVGLAAGTDEKAIDHALYEIMERDYIVTASDYKNIVSDSFPVKIRETLEEVMDRGLTPEISVGYNGMPPYFVNASLKAEKHGTVFVYRGSRYNPDPEEAVEGALSEAIMAYVANQSPEFSGKCSKTIRGLDFQNFTQYSKENAFRFFEKTKIPVYSFTISKDPYVVRVISPDLCIGGERI